MKLVAKKFKVLNYRNIDDSGWIPLERVTAFVGRNEAGKTALLKALHKFNPAVDEPYDPQREFPRDRFTAERKDIENLPVCMVEFDLSENFRESLADQLGIKHIPQTATVTRFYGGYCKIKYDTQISDNLVDPTELVDALKKFAQRARRIKDPKQAKSTQALRTRLAQWADEKRATVVALQNLRTEHGVELIKQVGDEANDYSEPLSADLIEELQETVESVLGHAQTVPLSKQLDDAVESALPVFVYFENYGILDSAVYLPRFVEDLNANPTDPRVRTVNAMFKHTNLSASEIADLGREEAQEAKMAGQKVTSGIIERDQKRKELRAVELNSAGIDISAKFNEWFGQRRHKIRYQADGDYFRIWVSDDRRPDVDIELESRSKGFQWFFSFYLVFLVESNEGHKDAMLLLDEPGLHLHPTAQQKLITFFRELANNNPIAYTTHSPFLIDGQHIHNIRPVTEDKTGHSRISVDTWPDDWETIFPLQAAAGYAMVKGLFQHKKNVLVEGMSDYLYLHALNLHCHATGRTGLPDDIYITPCGGTKYVGHIASLFLGQKVRPIVLLDGDDAGFDRKDALMKELYTKHEKAVLMLSDVPDIDGCEIEDIIGEIALMPAAKTVLGGKLQINEGDRSKGTLVDQIKSAAGRHKIELIEGWKHEVARQIIVEWSMMDSKDIPNDTLDRAEALFIELNNRFEALSSNPTNERKD